MKEKSLSKKGPLWWISELDNRMDAESYRPWEKAKGKPNLVGLSDEMTSLLTQINKEYGQVQAAILEVFKIQKFKPLELHEVIEEVKKKVKLSPSKTYKLLGVRWWGRGVFVREEKRGKAIKAKSLFEVSKGWIIYNRLFAFRGRSP